MKKENYFLIVKNLKKTYWKKQILKWINFNMKKWEVLWYIWPNWAWKTTTIKILLGINNPDNWSEIIINWKNVQDIKKENIISYLPEKLNLPEYMKWSEYIKYIIDLSELNWIIKENDVIEKLELVKFPKEAFNNYIKTYSKWMQQRLWLMAILINPKNKLIILDEPVSGLDPLWQSEMIEIIKELKNKWKSIFITTHQMNEVEDLCDNVLFIENWKMKDYRSVKNALNEYWNMYNYYKTILKKE